MTRLSSAGHRSVSAWLLDSRLAQHRCAIQAIEPRLLSALLHNAPLELNMTKMTSILVRLTGVIALVAAFVPPVLAQAQKAPGQSAQLPAADNEPRLTREQVSRETERAMRDGTWRCRTSNRGWCSYEAQVPAGPLRSAK